MIVDVDIGNTRLKWRVLGEQQVHACESWVAALEHWRLLPSIERVRVSSVVDVSQLEALSSAVRQAFDVQVEVAQVADGRHGIRLAYADCATLGVDRWLSMLSVRSLDSSHSWLLFGAGTALTADFLHRDGRHLGGYIIPGARVSASALVGNTEQISIGSLMLEKNWQPGGTTLECVQGGMSAMYQSYMYSVYRQACELMPAVSVAWSGGAGAMLRSLLDIEVDEIIRPSLVLDGLPVALP